jgi:twitching motility protein PilT
VLLGRVDTKGMVAAYEFLVVTPAIANLIRDNKSYRIDSAIQTGKKYGMQLLDDHLWSLYSKGMISPEEMIDKCKDSNALRTKVHQAGGIIGRPEMDDPEAQVQPDD